MTIVVQLINGQQYRCFITGEQASTEFLEYVRFWELFERGMLRIHRPQDTWAINPGYIEKIQFMTEADPGWRPPENIIASKCVSLETYQRKVKALDVKNQERGAQFAEGKITEVMVRITLASGAVEYFEYQAMLKSSLEQKITLSRLFQKVAYTIPCEGGGFVLLNPARIVCIHLHPAPSESTDSAWLVEGVEESLEP